MKNNKILHIFLTMMLAFVVIAPQGVKAETTGTIPNSEVISPTHGSTTEHRFNSTEDSYYIVVVTRDNAVWTATPSASWIKTSKTTGSGSNPGITISVERNPYKEMRSGSVRFATSEGSFTFNVYQNGSASGISSSSTSSSSGGTGPVQFNIQYTTLNIAAYGENVFDFVGSNYAWVATSENDWIYFVDPNCNHGNANGGSTLYIGVKPNKTGYSRQGRILVKAGGQTRIITIYQKG